MYFQIEIENYTNYQLIQLLEVMLQQFLFLNFEHMFLRITTLFIFFQFIGFSQEVRLNIENDLSFIEYAGKHLLHDWEGINQKIKGIVLADKSSRKFNKIALLANVRDFDSNNSGRDSHSLEVLEALRYPEVKFYSEKIVYDLDTISFAGSLEFHGVTIDKTISAKVIETSNQLQLTGGFQLIPSDFGIVLPSFMTVKMKDLLDFTFRIVIIK